MATTPSADLEASLARLREGSARCRTLEEHFDFMQGFSGQGPFLHLRRAHQQRAEACALLRQLQREKVRVAADIGTGAGGMLYLLTRVAADDGLLVSVDAPGIRFPWGVGDSGTQAALVQGMGRVQQRVVCARGDPRRLETRLAFERVLGHGYLDFLVIDGDRSYDAVKTDFANYRPYVRSGGLVAFLDIRGGHGHKPQMGARDFWREIKPAFPTQAEYIADANQTCCGIGVVRMP